MQARRPTDPRHSVVARPSAGSGRGGAAQTADGAGSTLVTSSGGPSPPPSAAAAPAPAPESENGWFFSGAVARMVVAALAKEPADRTDDGASALLQTAAALSG